MADRCLPSGAGTRPLCVDLFCGLGGWAEGFIAQGWDVVGFDLERHQYGDHQYPAQLVLQDVRTISGSQFAAEIRRRPAFMFVASSPCQEFSYRAMPWTRAKALGPPVLGMELFAQAERIRREAEVAAGRKIPLVQENVRGAQRYVGRARWHYGSYYLWGDVPALMPFTLGDGIKQPGFSNPRTNGKGSRWWEAGAAKHGSKSNARKAASAAMAKIPFPLASHIAATYYPRGLYAAKG